MPEETVDLLKIKIEKAKRDLPLETVNAIDAVDWRTIILGLRAKRGYTFEQLGDLELETELLLSGLVSPENYPRELERRMKISRAAVNELVNEMNDLVFRKIKEELVKNTERKKIFAKNADTTGDPIAQAIREEIPPKEILQEKVLLSKDGIEILDKEPLLEISAPTSLPNREDMLKKIEKPEEVNPILAQKLSGSVQIPTVKTEHSLDNMTKPARSADGAGGTKTSKADPYREMPE